MCFSVRLPKVFNPVHTFTCGQCFRWEQTDSGLWHTIAHGRVVTLHEREEELILQCACEKDYLKIWRSYFDLDTDYTPLYAQLCAQHPVLHAAVQSAPGIRILRQEPWEVLCTFILSQNNHIPRIKGIVKRLCACFGEELAAEKFAFPTPEKLASLDVEALAPVRCGFRAKYLIDAAQKIMRGIVDLQVIAEMELPDARSALMQIAGVGPKVAECTLLYGLHRMDAFPIDVWMRRALTQLCPEKSPSDFGAYAGLAQQYLFHYSRTHPAFFL